MSTAVVVPAHNEESTLAGVLAAIVEADVGPLIVVADACTDRTAAIASSFGTVVESTAQDKGSALSAGLAKVVDSHVLFVDADLVGLRADHVAALSTLPPLGGQLVGITEGNVATPLPPISGQRRLPTEFVRRLDLRGNGYRVELLIDAAVGNARLPWKHVVLRGVHNSPRPLRHPAMFASLAATAAVNLGGLARYTLRGVNRS